MPWLVRGEEVLASAELASTHRARRNGLSGREQFEGALVLTPCRHVHTFGMRFPIDIAFCDGSGRVLAMQCLSPRRVSKVIPKCVQVVEAAAGSFARWNLQTDDVIEIRP